MIRTRASILFFLLAGCEDFADGSGGAGGERSGTTATNAVSTTTSTISTASAADTTSTSTGPSPQPAIVHVVDERDAPVAGVLVFASDAEGALIDEAVSDDTGAVALTLPTGGSLHVAREVANFRDGQLFTQRDLRSHYLVPEGAELTVAVQREGYVYTTPAPRSMNITISAMLQDGATSSTAPYTEIRLDCEPETGPSVQSQLHLVDYEGCLSRDTFTIYALGYDEQQHLIAAGRVAGIPFESGVHAFTVPMTRASYSAMSVTLRGWEGPEQELRIGISGNTEASWWTSLASQLDTPQLTHGAEPPHNLFEIWRLEATASIGSPPRSFRHIVHMDGNALPESVSVDAHALAAIHVADFDATDPKHPRVRAGLEEGPRGDFVSSQVRWEAPFRSTAWVAYVPPQDDVDLRMPALPPSISHWTVQPGDYLADAWVQHFESETLTSSLDGTKNFDWENRSWTETSSYSE